MAKRPLIALITNNDDDVYCFRLELIQAILSAGYRLLISCPDGPKFQVMEEMGLRKNREFIYDDPAIDRRGTSIINDGALMLHYFGMFRKYRPAAVLTYTAKPNVYATLAAAVQGIPVINNVTGLGSVIKEQGLKKRLIMLLFKTAYRRSSCIMFQNETNMRLAEELGWVRGRSMLIPGSGVALGRYPVQEYPEGGDGLTGRPVVFNYIGRIMHDKGVDDYIEAARRIKARYPLTEFNMLGFIEPTESRYKSELAALREQGTVFYRGSQKDVRPWIKRAHAIIHPSTYGEGMSNVLLENAASGRPIITTDNPGCRETVDEGTTGFIFPGGDVEELTRRIEHFVHEMTNEERRAMGLAGREKVAREFDREKVIRAYLSNIRRLAGPGRKPRGKIRVFMVLGDTLREGAQTFAVNVLRLIDRDRFQVDFVVNEIFENSYADEIRSLGSHIYVVPYFRVYNWREYSSAWHKLLRAHPAHIVHGHISSCASVYLKIARSHGCRTIAHSHSAGYRGSAPVKAVKRAFTLGAKRQADYWLACSAPAAVRMFGKSYRSYPRYYDMPNAIITRSFLFDQETRDRLRSSLGLAPEQRLYGHVGSFTAPKNHGFLLRVFRRIADIDPGARLVLCGDGELGGKVRETIHGLGLEDRVILAGSVGNVREYMWAMDVMIFPSLFEGFPVTVLEAQAAGLPVVMSDRVTDEVKVTELVKALPLEAGEERWAETVMETRAGDRAGPNGAIAGTGYDMEKTVRKLEEIYAASR